MNITTIIQALECYDDLEHDMQRKSKKRFRNRMREAVRDMVTVILVGYTIENPDKDLPTVKRLIKNLIIEGKERPDRTGPVRSLF